MKKIKTLEYPELEKLLCDIQKPGRYVDHEIRTSSKDPAQLEGIPGSVTCALAFPDIYEIGMPNLGLQILYDIINRSPGFSAERIFSPWTDFEERLRETGTRIFSLENRIFLDCFDMVGFNLQHELLYTNMLNMLDLGKIPLHAEKRGPEYPLICAGGPAMVNPQPVSIFTDFIVIGDGEEVIIPILERVGAYKEGNRERAWFLKQISSIDGVYIPSAYKFYYFGDGRIKKIDPPAKVKKAILADLDSFEVVKSPVIPNIKPVHDRFAVEIMRGCARGCRFCQAGFIYRPVRQRKVGPLIDQCSEGLKNTGYDEISFLSLSSADYRDLNRLVEGVLEKSRGERLSISFPSLRLDSFNISLAELIQGGRKTGLTFAPEAGSQRMRDIISKNITESQILDCISIAFGRGWEKVKLYFMIGFPGENQDDILAIPQLVERIADIARASMPPRKRRRLNINININVFNPKPFTPFQWAAQDRVEVLEQKFKIILENIPKRSIKVTWSQPEKSQLECALSKGDTRMCKVVEEAWQRGAKFDNWTDIFDLEAWKQAFSSQGLEPGFYTTRGYSPEEILPWDNIDIGVSKKFLISQYNKAIGLLK
ncbi:MAG: TIGR03960 family B12-binding radical SAM protein [Actinomycetia bacterium]|nr:TIGR03960 family B12-binding radical SAM protein [Actinomycetes bacterium]